MAYFQGQTVNLPDAKSAKSTDLLWAMFDSKNCNITGG
jgi:hypothetical protein